MTDRIDFGGQPWRAVPAATLRDQRLTPKAKGGLVSLLSHDEGWVRSAIAMLQRENDCGRDMARSIMRELVAAGYAELFTDRKPDGTIHRHYVVRAVSTSPAVVVLGTPGDGEPVGQDTHATGRPSIEVEPQDDEPQDVEPKDAESNAAPDGASGEKPGDNVVSFVPDRWPYFVDKLRQQDDAWKRVSIGACVKIAQGTSVEAVSTALSFAAVNAPVLTGSAYGWLKAAAEGLHREAVG